VAGPFRRICPSGQSACDGFIKLPAGANKSFAWRPVGQCNDVTATASRGYGNKRATADYILAASCIPHAVCTMLPTIANSISSTLEPTDQ
jgi:hypothetical protein